MNGVEKMTPDPGKTGENHLTYEDSDKNSCLRRMRTIIPAVYRNELVELFKLTGPVVRDRLLSDSVMSHQIVIKVVVR